mgnify:CR=1 FL=1
MDILVTLLAAALLSVERLTYRYAWKRPGRFAARVRRTRFLRTSDPVQGLRSLFVGFKLIQVGVLLGWCMWFGRTWLPLPEAPPVAITAGVTLIVIGQILNASVMHRLGNEGVFYGNRFGRDIPWQTGFPFSLVAHPQYLGALASVWGFMLAMRFPNPDWVVVPLISTVYYAAGARLER